MYCIHVISNIQGWIYWGGGGGARPLALARGGAGGVLFFMIKQKNY